MLQVELEDDRLVLYDEDGNCKGDLCDKIEIPEKKINLLTGDTVSTIVLWNGESARSYEIKREDIVPSKIMHFLLKKNVNVTTGKDVNEALCNYLIRSDYNAKEEYFHDSIGFEEIDDKLVFLADKVIGVLGDDRDQSVYSNQEETACNGSLQTWLDMVNEEVIGKTELELALAIGVSAPLAYLLRKEGAFAEVPVVALVGTSSTGKTSTLRLIASMFGSPHEGVGLVKDMNATKVAFFKDLGRRPGFPLIIDEAMIKRDWNLSDAIYEVSKGIEKATCTSNRNLNVRSTFSGTVVFTSEKSILEDGKITGGKVARLVELTLDWFRDADHARRVSQKINANHGSAVYPLLGHILEKYEEDNLCFNEMFNEELAVLHNDNIITNSIEERLLNTYATIIVAAKVANDALGLALDVEAIKELLVKNHQKNAPVDSQADAFYYYLVEKVILNANNFPAKSDNKLGKKDPYPLYKMMGERVIDGDKQIIYISQETFKEFAEEKFTNYATLVPLLADKGLMRKDQHRHYKFKRTLNIGKVPCYGLIVDDWDMKPEAPKIDPKFQEKMRKQEEWLAMMAKEKEARMAKLLADDDDEEVVKEVVNGESDLQNLPQQSEIENGEELKSA